MANLQYYQDERIEFKEAFDKKFSGSQETEMIANKLLRHFKLARIKIDWTSGRNHAHAGLFNITLNLDRLNYGELCHELAHYYVARKSLKRGHNKVHKRIMKRIINYCSKKNWFSEEIQRRLAPKPTKPQPTKLEMKARELIKIQEKVIKYEKKVMFYQRKLSKAKKSYSLRIRRMNILEPKIVQEIN